jgi:hypothetical protein
VTLNTRVQLTIKKICSPHECSCTASQNLMPHLRLPLHNLMPHLRLLLPPQYTTWPRFLFSSRVLQLPPLLPLLSRSLDVRCARGRQRWLCVWTAKVAALRVDGQGGSAARHVDTQPKAAALRVDGRRPRRRRDAWTAKAAHGRLG